MDMDADLIIRPIAAEDADRVADMCNAFTWDLYRRRAPASAETVRRDFIDGDFGLELLVAERGGALVGYALHSVIYETMVAERGRYLSDLYVAPEARGCGVARALIGRIAAIAQAEGGGHVWWLAAPSNRTARVLYEKISDHEDTVISYAVYGPNFRRMARDGAPGSGEGGGGGS